MAQETRYTSHDDPYEARYSSEARYGSQDDQFRFSHGDQLAEPVDLDEFGTQISPYQSNRSVATREDFLSNDSVPLFLSGSGAPNPPRSGGRAGNSRRLLKTSILGIAAAAAAFATLSVKNPFTVFANATASLIGISDVRSATVPSAPAIQPAAGAQAQAGPAREMPTRDEIAVALRTAHQSQAPAEIRQPVAVAVAAPVIAAPPVIATPPVIAAAPIRRLAADELGTLMTRARGLLAAGDIPPARLLLERAADAQEAGAALMLAQTYDPAVLGRQDIRNITPDPALARTWYQRAAQLGSADAQRRLSQLQ
jgi:hypothetical protein